MIRILFLIRDLVTGGAQRQLSVLARGLDRRFFEPAIVTMYARGALCSEFGTRPDIPLVSLDKKGRWDNAAVVGRLAREVRARRPHIIHGYMGGANELALAMGKAFGARVVWGIRASEVQDADALVQGTILRVGVSLSRFADLIICNSVAGRSAFAKSGYPPERMVVIPNGIDTEVFDVAPAEGEAVRREWGVDEGEALVGVVARLDPLKDHETFVRAAALAAETPMRARFVCVGGDAGGALARLRALASSLGIERRIIWAGERSDLRAVYNALDVLVSSSCSEGFSNSIAEGMACALPCIVTDVGDSAIIVGDTGSVVPSRDPEAMGRKIREQLAGSLRERSNAARVRVVERFSTRRLVEATSEALHTVCARPELRGEAQPG